MNLIPAPLNLDAVRAFCRERILPEAMQRDVEARFATEVYAEMWKHGWMQACLPAEHGGGGVPLTGLLGLAREIAYASAGAATTFMANLLGFSPVALFGAPPLQKQVFEAYRARGGFFAFAMTESAVGFDVAQTRTTARPTPGGYLLSGQKSYISNGSHASWLSVFALQRDAADQALGLSCFLVPADAPGFRRGTRMNKLGQREADTCEIHLENVFVPEHHLLGRPGQGGAILHRCLGRTKTLIAAASTGLCQRASDLAVEHLRTRLSAGKPLLAKSNLQQLLARYHTEMDAAWLLAERAAKAWDTGDAAIKEASQAKMFAADLAVRFTSEALELVGAQGYSADHEISKLFRDAKLLEIYEGSSQILEILIGKELFAPKAKSETGKERKAA